MSESSSGNHDKKCSKSEMECRFIEVASRPELPEGKYPTMACPDKIWGELKYSGSAWTCQKYDLPLEIPKDPNAAHGRRIVVVLESPHTSEFENQEKPIGPAQGVTGVQITNRLVDVLQICASITLAGEYCYQIVVINAIQYQCSRGVLNSYSSAKKRDEIFREFWYDHGRKDFICRLEKLGIWENGHILINACTKGKTRGAVSKGSHKPNGWLYELVDTAINTAIKEGLGGHQPTLHTHHPCSWNRYADEKVFRPCT